MNSLNNREIEVVKYIKHYLLWYSILSFNKNNKNKKVLVILEWMEQKKDLISKEIKKEHMKMAVKRWDA